MKSTADIDCNDTALTLSNCFFRLSNTLDSYEVEELDGHEVAKLLLQPTSGMEESQGTLLEGGILI